MKLSLISGVIVLKNDNNIAYDDIKSLAEHPIPHPIFGDICYAMA